MTFKRYHFGLGLALLFIHGHLLAQDANSSYPDEDWADDCSLSLCLQADILMAYRTRRDAPLQWPRGILMIPSIDILNNPELNFSASSNISTVFNQLDVELYVSFSF